MSDHDEVPSLAALFETYLEIVYPNIDLTEGQRDQIRQAFYGGANSIYNLMARAAILGPTLGPSFVASYRRELADFYRECERRHHERGGSG